ncbi:hypothetical protein ACFQ48_13350 [Hymenobacter caeli]|uniref:Uncharacterized protein n=1 Tax=Hymenobacter caeli TaxID=2735894 RepID=A0ABX2FT74_9BACT|nr:hypothetical protein [Hymenobacter caeli]NRT20397.1 hypothetical protein [Hymenobacter caeli]
MAPLYAPLTASAATTRTLHIWLLGNLGGTGWLLLDFCRDCPTDFTIPLGIGAVAALLSLACVPLAVPFFAFTNRYTWCIGWRCRLFAVLGAVLTFFVGNYLFVTLLPLDSIGHLFSITEPYLCASLLAVGWIYRARPAPGTYSLKRLVGAWRGLQLN